MTCECENCNREGEGQCPFCRLRFCQLCFIEHTKKYWQPIIGMCEIDAPAVKEVG